MDIQLTSPALISAQASYKAVSGLLAQLRLGQQISAVVEAQTGDNRFLLKLADNAQVVSAQSQLPLAPGQVLKLEVIAVGELPKLKILAPPTNASPETVAIGQALRQFLPQQLSLAELAVDLQKSLETPADTPAPLPEPLRATIKVLLDRLPRSSDLFSPEGLKRAVENSGLFREAGMASPAAAESAPLPAQDLKSQLLALAGTLNNNLPRPAAETGASLPDPKALALSAGPSPATPQTAAPPARSIALPPSALSSAPAASPAPEPSTAPASPAEPPPASAAPPAAAVQSQPARAEPALALLIAAAAAEPETPAGAPPSSAAGAVAALEPKAAKPADGAAPPPAAAAIPRDKPATAGAGEHGVVRVDAAVASGPPDVKSLLQKTEGALAGIVLDQLASLPRNDDRQAIWQLQIPFSDGRQSGSAKLKIAREHRSGARGTEPPLWTVLLELDPPGLGAVNSRITLNGPRVDTYLWSDQASTAALIQSRLELLSARLRQAGLDVGQVQTLPAAPRQDSFDLPTPSQLLSERV